MTAPVVLIVIPRDDHISMRSPDFDESSPDPGELTTCIRQMMEGDRECAEFVVCALYKDMRNRAAGCLGGDGKNQTLQVTDLVSEAYLRLEGAGGDYRNRDHFLAAIATAMRWVVVDNARRKLTDKRQPSGRALPLDELIIEFESRATDLIALDEALIRLKEFDPQMARAVELKFFAGLDAEATAQELGISRRTLTRKWSPTLAWLRGELL